MIMATPRPVASLSHERASATREDAGRGAAASSALDYSPGAMRAHIASYAAMRESSLLNYPARNSILYGAQIAPCAGRGFLRGA